MADGIVPADGQESIKPPPVADAPAHIATPSQVSMSSEALKARLEEERGKARANLLKDFGFENPKDLKAVLDAVKAKQDAELSEAQRLAKALEETKPRAERADKLEKMLAGLVESQFAALPEQVREAIDKVADGNAEERLRMMDLFRSSGLLNTPATAAAPISATTTPPSPPRPITTQTAWDKYQALMKSNPLLASAFYQSNRAAIDQSRPAQ
jgi:hypothetical protein